MSQNKAISLGLKYQKVHMGLFDYSVVFITGDHAKAMEYCAWLFGDKELIEFEKSTSLAYPSRGQCLWQNGYVPVVWLPALPRTPRELATLSHECIHAIRHMFNWAGIPTDESTEEVYAHSVAHLITSYLEKNK